MTATPELESVEDQLRRFRERTKNRTDGFEQRITETLEEVRVAAVASGDQCLAKRTWCLRRTVRIQERYVDAFDLVRSKEHYKAWCALERVEIDLQFLRPHMAMDSDEYALAFIGKHAPQMQKLFPYRLFTSPAFIEQNARCSICDKETSIREYCGHTIGEIYDGVMCTKIVNNAELLEVSIVEKPVMKSNVLFAVDPHTGKQTDLYDYTAIDYVVRGLHSPFDAWELHKTTRRAPHRLYRHIGRNAPCPCGSRKRYKSCCLRDEGVIQPHLEIDFAVRPPADLPPIIHPRV